MRAKELIAVVCYNRIEFWESRQRAIKFYRTGAEECDGCESERYTNIVWSLMDGEKVCEDGASYPYEYLVENNMFRQFRNGTNVRDFNGRISSPTDNTGICTILSGYA